MNKNSEIIFRMCSHLTKDGGYIPYKPAEWSKLSEKLMQAGMQPCDLPGLSDSEILDITRENTDIRRIRGLLDRGDALAAELGRYENMGISVVTRADPQYPANLKEKLGRSCPPLLYYAGNIDLASRKAVSFTGSRETDENDRRFTDHAVSAVTKGGYIVVSGGARGVDTLAAEAAFLNSSAYVAYMAMPMTRQLRNSETAAAIREGRLLMLTSVDPDTEFSSGIAMMRNRYIYAHAEAAVVVRSDYKQGGTWNGAADCLKRKISPVFCWDNPVYRGNQGLMELGALPVDEDWNGDITAVPNEPDEDVQLSFFD